MKPVIKQVGGDENAKKIMKYGIKTAMSMDGKTYHKCKD